MNEEVVWGGTETNLQCMQSLTTFFLFPNLHPCVLTHFFLHHATIIPYGIKSIHYIQLLNLTCITHNNSNNANQTSTTQHHQLKSNRLYLHHQQPNANPLQATHAITSATRTFLRTSRSSSGLHITSSRHDVNYHLPNKDHERRAFLLRTGVILLLCTSF